MNRLPFRSLVVTGLVLAAVQPARCAPGAPEDNKVRDERKAARTDCYGDLLPDGALTRFGTVRLRHDRIISALSFDLSGHVIASASQDGTVRLWEVATGKQLGRLGGTAGAVFSVMF